MMSRKKAIENFCKQCIYDPEGANGTWRQQTQVCTAKSCPLFDFRPKSEADSERNEDTGEGKV